MMEGNNTELLLKKLEHIENGAYGAIVRAFKAQGELSWQKEDILTSLRAMLHISESRHRAELLRCAADPFIESLHKQTKETAIQRPTPPEIDEKDEIFEEPDGNETDSGDEYVADISVARVGTREPSKRGKKRKLDQVQEIDDESKKNTAKKPKRSTNAAPITSTSAVASEAVIPAPVASTIVPATPAKQTTTPKAHHPRIPVFVPVSIEQVVDLNVAKDLAEKQSRDLAILEKLLTEAASSIDDEETGNFKIQVKEAALERKKLITNLINRLVELEKEEEKAAEQAEQQRKIKEAEEAKKMEEKEQEKQIPEEPKKMEEEKPQEIPVVPLETAKPQEAAPVPPVEEEKPQENPMEIEKEPEHHEQQTEIPAENQTLPTESKNITIEEEVGNAPFEAENFPVNDEKRKAPAEFGMTIDDQEPGKPSDDEFAKDDEIRMEQ